MKSLLLAFGVCAWCAAAARGPAQCQVLPAPLTGTIGQQGTTFDVVNLSSIPLTITGFDQAFLAPGTAAFEVYTRSGTGLGSETNAAAWTLAASTSIAHGGPGATSPVGAMLSIVVAPGARQGFCLTCTGASASAVSYGAGANQLDAVIASDGVVEIRCGVGVAYPFAGVFGALDGRPWNGALTYGASAIPSWETNDAASSVTIDAVEATRCAPARTAACQGANVSLIMTTSLVGQLFEAAYNFLPALPFGPGAASSPAGQLVNLDFAAGVQFANGGTFALMTPHPGFLSALITVPGQLTATIQQLVVDPSHPDGFALSQAAQLDGLAGGAIPGPALDDSFVTVDFGGAPLCGPGAFPFYGTLFTRAAVLSNGHVQFGGGPVDLNSFPAPVFSVAGNGRAGAWCDLDPSAGGTIAIALAGGRFLNVHYGAVPYFNTTTTNTFDLSLDLQTGAIVLDNLSGIGPGGPHYTMLGLTLGSGATDPGQAAYAVGVPGSTTDGTSMIYRYGVSGLVAPGVNRITFLPNAWSNYDWTCQ